MIAADFQKKRKLQIALVLIVLAALGLLVFLPRIKSANDKQTNQKTASKSATESSQATPSASGGQTTSGNGNSGNNNTPPTEPKNLSKPILNKSSGNSGPVPAGAVINFICTFSAGNKCDVIVIENKPIDARRIDLGFKDVVEDRGQTAASWYWTSLSGNWTVYAIGQVGTKTVDSDFQTLEVQ